MLAPPRGLDSADLAAVLREAWSLRPRDLVYAPVGFGSHHWLAAEHFVTVDGADDADELTPALRTAYALRHDAGLEFVIAPLPAGDGSLVVPVAERWIVHVYERLDVIDDTRFGPHEEPEVLDLVAAIHRATPVVAHCAGREDFSIWCRDDLEEALGDLDDPWDTGPYGDRARRLLIEHADDLRRVLAVHDRLVRTVGSDGWVVTHGEPHRGNIFRTRRGWAIVDWDTALLAPPERDLWRLPAADRDPDVAELYRLRWDLAEIAVYTSEFYDDHTGDANDDKSWQGLVEHLDLRRRWPHLL